MVSTRHKIIARSKTPAATPMPARAPALSGALVGTEERLGPTLDEGGAPIIKNNKWYNIMRQYIM